MVFPTSLAIDFFQYCEGVYQQNPYAISRGGDPLDEVMKHIEEVGLRDGMPECHLSLLIARFFKISMYFRVRQTNGQLKKEKYQKKKDKVYASKSAAGHALR